MRHLLPALLIALAAAAACLVPEADLAGKACDSTHPCASGYSCQASVCVALGADASAGPDAGSLSCTLTGSFCSAGAWYECEGGAPRLKAACADAGLDCEGVRGCLAPCGSGCASGTACDESVQRCVRQPSCESGADCTGASVDCESGACLPHSSAATVSVDDGGLAQLSCYSADAGLSGSGTATLSGYVVTASGYATDQTIGLSLKVFRAEDFAAGDDPPAVASGTVTDGRTAGADAGVGAFSLAEVPVGVPLVAEISGTGALTTLHYFDVRPADVTSGEARQSFASCDPTLWGQLVAGAGIEVREGRGGLMGQVFDCRSSPAKVAGATVALDTPAQAFYAMPGLVAVDPEATATAENGRFFFFDVPALPLTLAVDLGGTKVARPVRVKPNSVTVVQVRPP